MRAGYVFLSHTSDMAEFPEKRSFVQAAMDAVGRAGMASVDMRYIPAHEGKPADYCRRLVRESQVYVGVVGFRYGSVVRDEGISFTELEFAEAGRAGLPRLVFLLAEDSSLPVKLADPNRGAVTAFRQQLSDSGLIVRTFDSADNLETEVLHALSKLVADSPGGARPAEGDHGSDDGRGGRVGQQAAVASRSPRRLTLKTAAAAIAVLGFAALGIFGLSQVLLRPGSPRPPASATAPPRPAGPSITSHPAAAPATATFDPDNMNSKSTDPASLSATSLLPQSFHGRDGLVYTRISAGPKPCMAPGMSENVRDALGHGGCASAMVGDYAGPGPSGEILVVVQIFPFEDSATAGAVYGTLNSFFTPGVKWDYGFWCPPSGAGAGVCAAGNENDRYDANIDLQYRYVVEASAIYTDNTSAVDHFTGAAAAAGSRDCGPAYYVSRQQQDPGTQVTPKSK